MRKAELISGRASAHVSGDGNCGDRGGSLMSPDGDWCVDLPSKVISLSLHLDTTTVLGNDSPWPLPMDEGSNHSGLILSGFICLNDFSIS